MSYLKYINIRTAIIFFTCALLCNACKKEAGMDNPSANKISPEAGPGGEVLTLTGSDLANIQSIVFERDNVTCLFNPTLNTENAIIFRVPDTASGGSQNIIFTNTKGKQFSVPFNVLAYPRVLEASDYSFVDGTTLELTGLNLEDVTKVVLNGTNDEATVVSKSKKKLVIKMPATSVGRAKLDISNPTGTSTTTLEFIYKPNNFVVFDDDWGKAAAYGGDVQSWSFDCNAYKSTGKIKAGTAALQADYTKGGGGLSTFLGCNWAANNSTFSQFYKAAYLTFWAYTEKEDANITIAPDNPWSGTDMWGAATASGSKIIKVEKDKWTYFKIPTDFITGNYSRLNFKIEGSGALTKTVFFDDMLMVK
jgi:hypothetical protein